MMPGQIPGDIYWSAQESPDRGRHSRSTLNRRDQPSSGGRFMSHRYHGDDYETTGDSSRGVYTESATFFQAKPSGPARTYVDGKNPVSQARRHSTVYHWPPHEDHSTPLVETSPTIQHYARSIGTSPANQSRGRRDDARSVATSPANQSRGRRDYVDEAGYTDRDLDQIDQDRYLDQSVGLFDHHIPRNDMRPYTRRLRTTHNDVDLTARSRKTNPLCASTDAELVEEPVYAAVNKSRQSSTHVGALVTPEPNRPDSPSDGAPPAVPNKSLHPGVQNHPFYLSAERNKETPTWFFENCAREDAEGLLTVGRKFGNVLLRPSLSNTSSGKYVISMRREVSGGTQLNHYVVVPCGNGYKIDVDNEHHPMKCLSDVMDFFVSVAGPGTNPFKTNNLSKIYGTGFDAPIGSGPRPSSDTSSSISQGSQQTSSSTWNRPAPSPPAWNHNQSPTFPNNGNGSFNPNKEKESSLFTKGQVDSALKQAVQEINESLAPAPPPPPAPKQTASWGPPVEYGNIDEYGEDNDMLHTPVPVRQPPADTIIRNIHPANSVPEGMSNRYMSDQGYDPQPYATRTAAYNDPHSQPYGTSRLSYQHPPSPPAPPPPPPMPGQFGGSNNIPAPPPISTMPSNAMRRNSEPNSPGQGMLHRQSSRGGGRPGGAGQTPVLSFEEELQSRLKPKREQIYAHANILRSNYNS